MYEMDFFVFLLGAVDALSVAIVVIVGLVSLAWLILGLLGLLIGGTETATVKTYRGGKLIGTQTYTQTFAESVFDPKFRKIGNTLYIGKQFSNTLSRPASNRFTDVLWFVFGMYCLSAIISIFYLTSNAEKLMYTENWYYTLGLGIVFIIFNGIFTFIIPITSRWSAPLAIIALSVKVVLSVFAGYNLYLQNAGFENGFILNFQNITTYNTLSNIGVFLWILVFIVCCVFPIAPRGKRLPAEETPRAYLFPFAYLYRNIDFGSWGSSYWGVASYNFPGYPNKSLFQKSDNGNNSILMMIIFLGAPVLIITAIGAIMKRPVTNQEIEPYFVLWITLLAVIILFIIKDIISLLISKKYSSDKHQLKVINNTKNKKRIYKFTSPNYVASVRLEAAKKLPDEIAKIILKEIANDSKVHPVSRNEAKEQLTELEN
jgi:hypothetical protein